MTGFGTLFIYRKRSETADDMCLLDIHYRRSGSFSTGFSDFFEHIVPDEKFAEQFLRVGLFQEASAKYGGLAENEIFFFAPALAFGGAESIPYIEKGDAVVHQHLLLKWVGSILPISGREMHGRRPMKQIPMLLKWRAVGLWLALLFRKP